MWCVRKSYASYQITARGKGRDADKGRDGLMVKQCVECIVGVLISEMSVRQVL